MSVPKKTTRKPAKKAAPKKGKKSEDIIPIMVSAASSLEERKAATSERTSYRRNFAGSIDRTDKFTNISKGLVPFRTVDNHGAMSVRDAVVLCQKAYYNFSTFRNVIDLMTEFSTSDIYFKGGSKKSRDFFEAFFKKIN